MYYKRLFTWDSNKAKANIVKHGVSFEKAAEVFADSLSVSQSIFENGEERWRTIGMVDNFAILLVVHTIRERKQNGNFEEIIRIISARKADKKERTIYAKGYF